MFILDNNLLSTILQKYGEDEQLRQTCGECAEFIAVCQNYHRAQIFGHRQESFEDVLKEAVDVFFMIQQVRKIDSDLFDKLCEIKYKKVLEKIKNET